MVHYDSSNGVGWNGSGGLALLDGTMNSGSCGIGLAVLEGGGVVAGQAAATDWKGNVIIYRAN